MLVRFLQENVKNDSFFEIYLEKVSACFANIHHHKNGNPFLDYIEAFPKILYSAT